MKPAFLRAVRRGEAPAEPIATPPGAAAVRSTPVTLVDLSPADIMWLDDLRDHLRPKGSDPLDAQALSACFDHYLDRWSAVPLPQRWDPRYLVSAIGVALGDLIVHHLEAARWQRVDDERAKVVAVRLEDRRVTVFPIDAVARRWHAEQRSWIVEWSEQMVAEG